MIFGMTTTEMGENTVRRPRGRPRAFDRNVALEKAMRLFWTLGYEGASISDLTREMGITPPSLYAAFGSKEALYREALDLYRNTKGQVAIETLAGETTARGSVEVLLNDLARDFTSPGSPAGCMISTAILCCAPENQGAAEAAAERRDFALSVLEDLFQKAVASGELGPDVEPISLARFYGAVIQGMSVQAKDGADEAALREIASNALRAWPGAR